MEDCIRDGTLFVSFFHENPHVWHAHTWLPPSLRDVARMADLTKQALQGRTMAGGVRSHGYGRNELPSINSFQPQTASPASCQLLMQLVKEVMAQI